MQPFLQPPEGLTVGQASGLHDGVTVQQGLIYARRWCVHDQRRG